MLLKTLIKLTDLIFSIWSSLFDTNKQILSEWFLSEVSTPWIQDVNRVYIRLLEDFQDL